MPPSCPFPIDVTVALRMDVRLHQVELLIGDPTKARTNMGWECKVRFEDLVKDMMQFDLKDVLTPSK